MDCRVVRRLNSTLCLLVLISSTAGCSLFGNNKLAQYAADNERLISDYRAERDRAAQLELQNRALTGRIAALESRLAAIADVVQEPQFQPASTGRQTQVPSESAPASQPTPRIPAAPSEPASSEWRRSGL